MKTFALKLKPKKLRHKTFYIFHSRYRHLKSDYQIHRNSSKSDGTSGFLSLFSKPMYTFFSIFEKRSQTIYKQVSDKSNKCLAVVVSVVTCVLAPEYISLCRGLEYFPKVRYIIVGDPLRDGFLIYFLTTVRNANKFLQIFIHIHQ